jgi:diguanylate cyclase (GGDEF)-like protein
MGRDALTTTGPVDEARTPPASVALSFPDSDPGRRLLRRRLAHQTALAQFARRALETTTLEPLRAEAALLVHQAFAAPASGAFELLPDADGDEVAFAASVADILRAASGAIDAAAACRHASLHDSLTGLANRALLLDHLQLALDRADRRSSLAAVIFLDLDGFKSINDTLGHRSGDEILVGIAERLRGATRPSDTLGRWGGDEFIVVCEDLERADDAPAIVARLAAVFDSPFATYGTDLHVAASIGVAVSGGGDDRPAELIHAADSAMYRVKHESVEVERQGTPAPVFPADLYRPRLEHLISHLLDMLPVVAADEAPAPGAERVAGHP